MAAQFSDDTLGFLDSWLECAPDTARQQFNVSNYIEHGRPAGLSVDLAKLIVHAKCDVTIIQRVFARLGLITQSDRLVPSRRTSVRHGDFGEVLSIGLIRRFIGNEIPVVKLRIQTDPEQTLHGTDIVGFSINTDELGKLRVDYLDFVEVKLRTSKYSRPKVATDAHSQLKRDRDAKFSSTLDFLLQRLEQDSPELMEAFEDYLASRGEDEQETYRLILIFEDGIWDDIVLDNLESVQDRLDPLSVDVVKITDLRALIAEAWLATQPELVIT